MINHPTGNAYTVISTKCYGLFSKVKELFKLDLFKIMFWINTIAISLNLTCTYLVIVNLIFSQPIEPFTIVALVFGYGVMIKHNYVFHELWDKWFKNRK